MAQRKAEEMYEEIAEAERDAGHAVVSGPLALPSSEENSALTRIALKATSVLQTTLDVARQIGIFSQEIAAHIPHDSFSFVQDEFGIVVEEGKHARNSCTYRLTVEERMLGEIRFTRRSQFSETEIADLEYLLCALVYPLRNALEYRNALEEARRDSLTGTHNRCVLDSTIAREVGLAHRHRQPLSVIFMDIDRFKSINDTHGHDAGDRAIRLFADILQAKIRNTDVLVRYGGDEFVIVLANTPIEGARLLADRIRLTVEAFDASAVAHGVQLTASVGVTALMDSDTPESFLKRADDHLNDAKRAGRNRVSG